MPVRRRGHRARSPTPLGAERRQSISSKAKDPPRGAAVASTDAAELPRLSGVRTSAVSGPRNVI